MTKQMNDLISGFALKTVPEIKMYASYIEDAMESGYFDIFAHPDLYLNSYKEFDKYAEDVAHRICKSALKYNIVLEYNANGYRRGGKKISNEFFPNYPRREFWKIVKEYNCKTIFGSDCHNPSFLYNDIVKEAHIYAEDIKHIFVHGSNKIFSKDTIGFEILLIRVYSKISLVDIKINCQHFFLEQWQTTGDYYIEGETNYFHMLYLIKMVLPIFIH